LYWLYLIFKSLKIKLIFNFECRRSELFLFIILQVSDNVIVRRSLLLPGYSGIGAFLDRLLQQRPKPTHLCVFQPRLPWRLQGYPKERLTLLRQLLEDTLAIRIIWHNSEKSVSERRVPSFFFSINFQPKSSHFVSTIFGSPIDAIRNWPLLLEHIDFTHRFSVIRNMVHSTCY